MYSFPYGHDIVIRNDQGINLGPWPAPLSTVGLMELIQEFGLEEEPQAPPLVAKAVMWAWPLEEVIVGRQKVQAIVVD